VGSMVSGVESLTTAHRSRSPSPSESRCAGWGAPEAVRTHPRAGCGSCTAADALFGSTGVESRSHKTRTFLRGAGSTLGACTDARPSFFWATFGGSHSAGLKRRGSAVSCGPMVILKVKERSHDVGEGRNC